MQISIPTNPYEKDAEAASKYVRFWLFDRKGRRENAPPEVIGFVARWAGHWGNLALKVKDGYR